MSAATLSRRKNWTIEDLVLQFGDIEFQQPMEKSAFIALAERYPDFRMEREPDGKVSIMSPVKKGTGKREFNLSGLCYLWFHQQRLGEFFSPSTGFDLPNGASKSPDIAWISPERLEAASINDDEQYVKIVPDFVAEVRSATDRLSKLKNKMTETWMANGVRLAWLIDPYGEQVFIYREGQAEPEVVEGFDGKVLTGEALMPGFELALKEMKRKV